MEKDEDHLLPIVLTPEQAAGVYRAVTGKPFSEAERLRVALMQIEQLEVQMQPKGLGSWSMLGREAVRIAREALIPSVPPGGTK